MTEAEAAEANRSGLERLLKSMGDEVAVSGELSEVWLELGPVVRSRRTSLIVDPPDGQLPSTPEGKKRRQLAQDQMFSRSPTNSWKDRPLSERCLHTGGLHQPNPFNGHLHQVFQTREHIAIVTELLPEVRIIPLTGQPPAGPAITRWGGISRGHWEGNTLVVETTNVKTERALFGSTGAVRLVERLTRIDAETIDYSLTATDPASFGQSWTLENTLRKAKGPVNEVACHEGNYGLPNILSAARAQERAAEDKVGSK